jgi:hypothetical protein
MKGKFKIPADVPAAACGRCIWFKLDRPDGFGKCRIWNDMYFYKCMVCEEYELDSEIDLGSPGTTMDENRAQIQEAIKKAQA